MDERKQLLTGKIKAIARPSTAFVIIIGIALLRQESDDTV